LECKDTLVIKKLRNVAKELLKEIGNINISTYLTTWHLKGRKLLSGQLNLTEISFPIKIMYPKSVLEMSVHGSKLIIID
jgi:chemotaxis protein CheY-P-specific phosphatase CheC